MYVGLEGQHCGSNGCTLLHHSTYTLAISVCLVHLPMAYVSNMALTPRPSHLSVSKIKNNGSGPREEARLE